MERLVEIAKASFRVQYPDQCPVCHHHSQINNITCSKLPDSQGVHIVFQCGFGGCSRFFIGDYAVYGSVLSLRAYSPQLPSVEGVPKSIKSLSSDFERIFVQAETARHLGLSDIAGPGYRKAFEFLIKDYAKSVTTADKHPEIDHAYSGKVVEKFIEHSKIQSIAKRALWLGNDESHYLRKWTDKDIGDLITLIRLTVDWIEIDRLSSEYTESMPEGS